MAHYIRPAKQHWSPPVLYVLDTETETAKRGDDEVEQLRLWCAATIVRTGPGATDAAWAWHRGRTAPGLASSIDLAATKHRTVWVYAHNLAFDLTTAQLPEHLALLGWTVTDFALSGQSPWMKLSRGDLRLVLADSGGLLPESLSEVARMVGLRRPRLPRQDGPAQRWEARCKADVTVLGTALLQLLDWHDREGRGRWSMSGTSTGWAHLRARIPDRTLVVDPRPEPKRRDRRALYGGRRQAWRVGSWTGHRYLELDLVDAYPTVAATEWLPCRRRFQFQDLPLDSPLLRMGGVGAIAQCVVTTDTPRYPLRTPHGVVYPVGTFATVLAWPELRDALDRGALVSIGAGELHDLAGHLQPWGGWVIEQRYGRPPGTPPVAARLAKMVGRTVIGRMAGHSWDRETLGPAPGPAWRYESAVDMVDGEGAAIVDLAGERFWTSRTDGSQTAYPAILAGIESRTRVVLGRVIDALGTGALLAADTDGVVAVERLIGRPAAGGTVVAPDGLRGPARVRWVLDRINETIAPFQLRLKRAALSASVSGPQHVTLGGQRHLPGVPAYAAQDDGDLWRWRAWPGLTWQMGQGAAPGYVRPLAMRKIDGPYVAGWVTDTGEVVAPRADVLADGRTVLRQWQLTPHRPVGARLAEGQHKSLADL